MSNNIWEISKVLDSNEDEYFYFLKDHQIDNKVIFFLAKDSEVKNSKEKTNKYTKKENKRWKNIKIYYIKKISLYDMKYKTIFDISWKN